MDRLNANRLKTNMNNTIFSNKTIFIKNRRLANNRNSSGNGNGSERREKEKEASF